MGTRLKSKYISFFLNFGYTLWLAESKIPDQGLNLGHDCESWESQPLDHEGTPSKFISLVFSIKKNTHERNQDFWKSSNSTVNYKQCTFIVEDLENIPWTRESWLTAPLRDNECGWFLLYRTWLMELRGFPAGSDGKESACVPETWVWSLSQQDPLEKGMATHFSVLARKIPWTEEPGRLPSVES